MKISSQVLHIQGDKLGSPLSLFSVSPSFILLFPLPLLIFYRREIRGLQIIYGFLRGSIYLCVPYTSPVEPSSQSWFYGKAEENFIQLKAGLNLTVASMKAKPPGHLFFSLKLTPNQGKLKLGKYSFFRGQGCYHARYRKNSQDLEKCMVERIMVNSMARMSKARWEECEWG